MATAAKKTRPLRAATTAADAIVRRHESSELEEGGGPLEKGVENGP